MVSTYNLALVFLGGGLGAVLRWLVTLFSLNITTRIWAGTFIANVIGSLIFFLIAKFAHETSYSTHAFIRVGLLGALTTFSTYSFEVVSLFNKGQIVESAFVLFINLAAAIGLGVYILKYY